jgi:hypothetical protein
MPNDNGGTALASAWTLQATGAGGSPTNLSGATPVISGGTFKADTYALSETGGPSGYTASQFSCVKNGGGAVLGSSITLAPGDTATCTITNNDIAPAAAIPTMTEWGMIIFMVLVGLMSIYYLRRQKVKV